MNVQVLFNLENGRCTGYASERYNHQESNSETLVQTTKNGLSEVFKESGVDELAGTGKPIEAAVEDPLAFRNFLILEDGKIVFDGEYVYEDGDDAEFKVKV